MKTNLLILLALISGRAYALELCTPNQIDTFKELDQVAVSLKEQFSIELDPKLLRSWDTKVKYPCAPPFKAIFKKGQKEIVFVAVSHISEPVEPSLSDLRILQKEIEVNKPEGVLVETVSGGIMPKVAFDGISKNCYQNKNFSCGEAAYCALVAAKMGAVVEGGEPIPPDLNETVLKIESNLNLLAYRSTQVILSFKRRGLPESKWSQKFMEDLSRNIDLSKANWSYDEYNKWLENNLSLNSNQVDDSWLEPKDDKSSTILNQISYRVDKAREPLILKNAEHMMNQHNKVMIFYGAAHFYKQSPVYEKIFGAPKIECLKK